MEWIIDQTCTPLTLQW